MILHPVWRHAASLMLLLVAVGSLALAAQINPHSTLWLVAVYSTGALLALSIRRRRAAEWDLSFVIYLFSLWQYLMAVWILHICVPTQNSEWSRRFASTWMHAFWPGCILMGSALLQFSIRFARRKGSLWTLANWASWLVAGLFMLLYFGGELFDGYVWTGVTWVPRMGRAYPAFAGFTATLVSLSLLAPILALHDSVQDTRRRQLIYYLVGAAPMWLACLSHFLLSMGVRVYPAGGVFFIWHIFLIAYATVKHRAFEFSITLRRGLAYASVSLVLGLTYGGLLWSIGSWGAVVEGQDFTTSIIFVVIAGFLFSPLAGYAQYAIDRFFFKRALFREKRFEEFVKEASSIIEVQALAPAICKLLADVIAPQEIRLYLHDRNGVKRLFAVHKKDTVIEPDWLNGLTPSNSAPAEDHAIRLVSGEDDLLIPITHRGEKVGELWLGPKLADEEYASEEVSWIESVAAHASVALANALAYAQLERLQHTTQLMLNDLTAGVLLLDKDGKVLQSNPTARRLLTSGEAGAATSTRLARDQPVQSEILSAIQNGRPLVDHPVATEGQPPQKLLLGLRTIELDHSDSLYLVLLHDITQFSEMEAKLYQSQELARVGEYVTAINHEIRNSVQPVRNLLVQLQKLSLHDPTFIQIMKLVPDRMSAMDRMLNSIRLYFRPMELNRQSFALKDLLDVVVQDLSELASEEEVQLSIRVSEGFEYCGDREWLRRVFYNLIKNAMESTAGRSSRLVSVTQTSTPEWTYISIHDTGWGMADDVRVRLFHPFFSTKGEPGTGLGLSLCKKVIDLHQGKIEVESLPGSGSCFTVMLPIESQDARVKPEDNITGSRER